MKNFLFDGVAFVAATLIKLNYGIATLLNLCISKFSYALMTMIDKSRLDVYEKVSEPDSFNELAMQQTELNLLNAASQVRDHAKETGDWTEQHTEAINTISESLLNEFNWEHSAVSQYMKEVVESIDGLEFELDDW